MSDRWKWSICLNGPIQSSVSCKAFVAQVVGQLFTDSRKMRNRLIPDKVTTIMIDCLKLITIDNLKNFKKPMIIVKQTYLFQILAQILK